MTDEQAPIHGRVQLQIRIGSYVVTQELWVADIQDDCILGLDYLRTNGCQVDLCEQVLVIGEEEIPLQKPTGAAQVKTYRAILESGVSLPPHAESVLPARVEGCRRAL